MSRPRTRSTTPVECKHKRVRHEHGTRDMYLQDGCGCDACFAAHSTRTATERLERIGRAPAEPITARGQFVVVFPFFGGMSEQHVRRQVRWPFFELAKEQGVDLVGGDPEVRFVRSGAGAFVRVEQPAVSRRPVGEVRARAEEFAWRHEQADPSLASWVTEQLEVA